MMSRISMIFAPALVLLSLGGCTEDPAKIPAKELVQSGCNSDDDCPGGTCVAGIGEGLCTADCSAQADCPEGTICTDTEAPNGVCLLACTNSSECSEHLGPEYNCDTESSFDEDRDVRVCIDGA